LLRILQGFAEGCRISAEERSGDLVRSRRFDQRSTNLDCSLIRSDTVCFLAILHSTDGTSNQQMVQATRPGAIPLPILSTFSPSTNMSSTSQNDVAGSQMLDESDSDVYEDLIDVGDELWSQLEMQARERMSVGRQMEAGVDQPGQGQSNVSVLSLEYCSAKVKRKGKARGIARLCPELNISRRKLQNKVLRMLPRGANIPQFRSLPHPCLLPSPSKALRILVQLHHHQLPTRVFPCHHLLNTSTLLRG
jgi:hypothetical protein